MDSYIDFYVAEPINFINNFFRFIGIFKYYLLFLQYCAKFILIILEWKLASKSLIHALHSTSKAVIIYPHTTYWDFVLMLLYATSEPKLGNDLICLVNQKFYNRFPRLMKLCGCTPTTSKETNNGGFIEETVKQYADKRKYKFLISPEGALRKCEWRSGYYWLAKNLNIPIIIVGTDYCTHMLRYAGTFDISADLKTEQEKFQTLFKDIVPLYPECSYVKIPEPKHAPSVVGLLTLTAFLCPIFTLYLLFQIAPITGLILLFCTIISITYHHYEEHYLLNMEPLIVKSGFVCYVITLYLKNLIFLDFVCFMLWGNMMICYILGSGRKDNKHRSCAYNKYHLLFHIFTGLASSYMLL